VTAKKSSRPKKIDEPETKPDQPPAIFPGGKTNKSASLILLGAIAVVLGFLSKTPMMAKTIIYTPSDLFLFFGIAGIISGLVINYRKNRTNDVKNSKKSK